MQKVRNGIRLVLRSFLGIRKRPVRTLRTPHSILDHRTGRKALYVGRRRRFATCSGLVWISGSRILTVNLLGETIHTYDLRSRDEWIPGANQPNLKGLARPENLCISPDGRLLAVSNSTEGSVCVFRVNRPDLFIDPEPIARIHNQEDKNTHGVAFSPCGHSLLFSTVDRPGCLRRYALNFQDDGSVALAPREVIPNELAPLKPKGVAYSPAGDLLAVCYGPNAGARRRAANGHVAIHKVDSDGSIRSVVSTSGSRIKFGCAEDVNFFPDGERILVTDQDKNSASVIGIDKDSGKLGDELMRLSGPWAKLHFPHGSAIAPDGKHFGIANYGSDTLAIFEAGDVPTGR